MSNSLMAVSPSWFVAPLAAVLALGGIAIFLSPGLQPQPDLYQTPSWSITAERYAPQTNDSTSSTANSADPANVAGLQHSLSITDNNALANTIRVDIDQRLLRFLWNFAKR